MVFLIFLAVLFIIGAINYYNEIQSTKKEKKLRKQEEEKRKKEEFEKKLKAAKTKLTKFCKNLFEKIDGDYLNHSKFIKLHSEAKVVYNELKEFHPYLNKSHKRFFSFVESKNFVKNYNENFITEGSIKYDSFFKNIDEKHFGLTEKQMEAVLTDEDATLINAGAGTGKTKTIENKIVYLHAIKGIPLNKILVITYSKSSQQDMMERITDTLDKAGVHIDEDELKKTVSTFHAFGKRIVDEYCSLYGSLSDEEKLIGKGFVGKRVIDENEQRECIQLVLDRMKKNPEMQMLMDNFLLYYNAPEYNVDDFENLDQYYKTVKRIYVTLIKDEKGYNVRAKSNGEVVIANYLVQNGVKVQYEPSGHYYTDDQGYKKSYKPDFYLPDYDIYIEYFGVDKKGKTAPYIPNKEYVKRMKKKIHDHEVSGNKFIDIRYGDFQEGREYFLAKLKRELKKYGVNLSPITPDETLTLLEGPLMGLEKILSTFLALYKESNDNIRDLRIKSQKFDEKNNERNNMFLDIFEEYLKGYSGLLQEGGFMDFGDMISDSKNIIKEGSVKREFSYILVDEFQDISEARANLIQNLIKDPNETRLFCVGDDWQSIYRFAGSNTNIFLKFGEYFGYTKSITLDKTFRFNQGISDVSGSFVMQNPAQTTKELKSLNDEKKDKIFIAQSDGNLIFNSILSKCIFDHLSKLKESEKRKIQEISIMYLTRYSHEKYDKYHQQDFFDYLVTSFKLKKGTENKQGKDIVVYKSEKTSFQGVDFIINCKPLTVHKAKGLEADYVVVDYVDQNNSYNFPSSFEDDPVLDLLLEDVKNSYLFSEERRLFYVATTRGKNLAFHIYTKGKQSIFLNDLLNLGHGTVKILNQSETSLLNAYNTPKCEVCGGLLRVSKYKSNLGSNFITFYCSNKDMGCDTKYEEYNGKMYKTPNDSQKCPKCGSSMVLRKRKEDGKVFWGCINHDEGLCDGGRDFIG